jgi:acetyl-CoA C-acetyltransferase
VTAHVTATGFAKFGRRAEPLVDLAAEASGQALEALGRKPCDLLVVGNMLSGALNGVENLVSRVANRIGLETAAGFRVEAASATGAAAFHAGVLAVESGRYDRVLVVAAEKMTDRPTPEVATALARSLHPTEQVAGATMPALAALVTERYMLRYGTDPVVIDRVSVEARRAAARNPYAQFQTPVTLEEVRASRPVSPPLRLLHCSSISDGAVAVVIERGEGPATVRGIGQAFEALAIVDRPDLTTFASTRSASDRAFTMAGLSRKEIGVIEAHDAFAPFVLIDLEDLGFAPPGTAAQWYPENRSTPSDHPPVNPSGGVIGRGHPVGASGLAAIAEIARQLRGEAGPTSVDPCSRYGCAQSVGGLASHNFVTILGAAPG